MATKVYAGIGSRRTPDAVLDLIERLAGELAAAGWLLRSGHVPGAGQAFERGADADAEIFLPWPTFEIDVPVLAGESFGEPTPKAYDLAAGTHKNWDRLKSGTRALRACNAHIVLGRDCLPDDRARFLVCWTADGSLTGRAAGARETNPADTDSHALQIARRYDVPVFNLARPDHLRRVTRYMCAA